MRHVRESSSGNVLALALFLAGAVTAAHASLAQSQPPTDPAPAARPGLAAGGAALPEDVRYRLFFRYVAHLEAFAADLEMKGDAKAAAAWRAVLQRRAGLSEQEGAVMKRIASDAIQALAANEAQLKPALATFRAQRLDAKSAPPQEIKQLQAARREIVTSHVEQLKEQLGEVAFKKLDAYVSTLYQNAVTTKAPGGSSASHAPGEQ